MAKYIEVGQEVVEFPDTMSDADIEKALATQFSGTTQPAPMSTQQEPKRTIWDEAGRQLGLTARAGITGLAGLPVMLAEPVAAGINALTGQQVFPNQAQALQGFLTKMGLPEPQGGLERAVQSGASAMANVGGQAQLAQQAGSQMFAPLARELPQQLAAAGAAGTAAQATSERAQEVGLSPAANVGATLAVGTLAGLVGAKGARVLTADKVIPVTIDQVKRDAARLYTAVDEAGVTVKPGPVLKTIDDIEATLINKENFNPSLSDHAPIQKILDQMRSSVGTTRVSFSKLDQLRQMAANVARESKDAATRRLAGQVVAGIDNKISSLQPTDVITGKANVDQTVKNIKDARDAWRKVSKATILEDALNVAEARSAAPSASEGELIRRQFINIASNKDKMRLFSKEEQEAIKGVTQGKGVEKLLALAARFNPERSQLMTGATMGASFANAPLAIGVAGGGMAADKALAAIQRKAAQDVISRILSGQIPRPRDNMSWRALVEAQARSYNPQQEQPQ